MQTFYRLFYITFNVFAINLHINRTAVTAQPPATMTC